MTDTRPSFSIVTAVYNVEPYLPDFIASIDAQTFDHAGIEVIVVDDGSTDGSLAILQAWARRRPGLVQVLTKSNGGQGSARNLGLEVATGEWVTFTDPDDMLDRDFLSVAATFAAGHPRVDMMVGKPMLFIEASGVTTDSHPRRGQFAAGDRVADLDSEPNTFAGNAATFYRLARLTSGGLRFDTRIAPQFEDGHLTVRYLLDLPRPLIGVLREARYIYRKRAAGDSALQQSVGHPGRYTNVLRYGYLDALERASARDGSIPVWLQQVIVYELSWYLSEEEKLAPTMRIAPELVPTFMDLFGRILVQLDPDVVRQHTARPLRSVWMDILAQACRPSPWHSPEIVRTKVDRTMRLQRLSYRFVGPAPRETFEIDGRGAQPVHAKTMAHEYFGVTLIHERIVWLPVGGKLRARIDDGSTAVTDGSDGLEKSAKVVTIGEKWWLYRRLPTRDLITPIRRRARRSVARVRGAVTRRLARTRRYRVPFAGAWVLMDRVHLAGDNAERLFAHVSSARPDINAWFVIEKDTPDWHRLRAVHGARVVAFGSFRWKMLMLNCAWLLSSHADLPIVKPPGVMKVLPKPTWRFGFLQHGVIKEDLSRWLNSKDIDLLVTSTQPEFESITVDETTYAVTTKETHRTGLPRFDRLLTRARAVGQDGRDLVIVAPTWRHWLVVNAEPRSQRRHVSDSFWASDYHRNWMAVLDSPRVAAAAAERGWSIAFMPHPNMQPILDEIDLPPHVRPLTYADTDIQERLARCALLVTDYSSIAFDVAYIDVPVVYFQFDRDEMMGGFHTGRSGYFDYEEDGFGAVALDIDAAIEMVTDSIERGPRPPDVYLDRIDRTFPQRDGGACARVVDAIEASSRPDRPLGGR